MPDSRFFQRVGPFSLNDIALAIDGAAIGSGDVSVNINDIATLESAISGEISVFTDVRYLDGFYKTRAEAIIVGRGLLKYAGSSHMLLAVEDPRLAFAKVGRMFYPLPVLEPFIATSAHVHPNAKIGAGSRIDSGAVIGDGVEIGSGCHVACNAVLESGVRLGDGSKVGANSSVSHALIGKHVEIATGVTIGSAGFGFVPGPAGLTQMPQLGRVIVGDRVQIGANCSIDRGAIGDTAIGSGSILDNQVHIAHNVHANYLN